MYVTRGRIALAGAIYGAAQFISKIGNATKECYTNVMIFFE